MTHSTPHTRFLLLALLLVSGPAAAVELELDLGLYNRFTFRANDVERLLRYAPGGDAFDAASYLAPVREQVHYSFLVSGSLLVEPLRWLGLGLSIDSGEVQPTGRVPATTEVSLTSLPPALTALLGEVPVLTTEDVRKVTANGQPITQEARETAFVRQVFLQLTAPDTAWLTVQGGRIATEVGGSLVYNDFALGASLTADLERLRDWPLRIEAQVLLPTRTWIDGLRSPLAELRVDYVLSSFLSLVESVGLTVAFFHDGDDNFGQLLRPLLSEVSVVTAPRGASNPALHRDLSALALSTAMSSRANILWLGLGGRKLLGDLMLGANLLLEVGWLTLDNPFYLPGVQVPYLSEAFLSTEQVKLRTLGVAIEATATFLFTPELSAGGFVLYLSGEENPFLARDGLSGTYGSFLAVVPYIRHTNLFFSGGMNETFSGRQATTSGINGRGVIALGPNLSWDFTESGTAEIKTALLFSQVPSIYDGSFYGFELDLQGSYRLWDLLKLSLEYDLLVARSFFAEPAVVHKLLLGLDLTYEL